MTSAGPEALRTFTVVQTSTRSCIDTSKEHFLETIAAVPYVWCVNMAHLTERGLGLSEKCLTEILALDMVGLRLSALYEAGTSWPSLLAVSRN